MPAKSNSGGRGHPTLRLARPAARGNTESDDLAGPAAASLPPSTRPAHARVAPLVKTAEPLQYDPHVPLRKDAKIELIRSVPLFSRCTKKELAVIASESYEFNPPEGTKLTKQGRRGREFIVIVEGSAEVVKNGRRVARLGPGDFLGEIALLCGAPRNATVTTTSPTRLLVLVDRAFTRVLEQIPSIRASLLRVLSERLQVDAL
jgi:CRP/FNR family transcriptional regulator, cyclic AMP receptor protein